MNPKKFRSKTAPFLYIVSFGSLLAIIIAFFFVEPQEEKWVPIILVSTISLFLFSIVRGTNYEFREDCLYLKMSFFRKKIPYESIKRVELGKHLWYVGYKFACAWRNTLVISFNTYDDVLISPENHQGFIDELKLHVPNLEVKNKK